MKLSRFIAKHCGEALGRTGALQVIAARRIRVNGRVITDGQHPIDRFLRVEMDDRVLQPGQRSLYLMLNKPAGILSATSDPVHPTVLDLVDDPDQGTLHLAGRLDRATTGLMLLTNDGRWSKRLMEPERKVPKVYRVETAEPIPPEAVEAFARGFYFRQEDITTLPAELEIMGARLARVTLYEGRHHQVKRMFHRVHNRVTALHRESIGPIVLPPDLGPGQWRALTDEEQGAFAG